MKRSMGVIGYFILNVTLFLLLFSYAMFQGGFTSGFLFFSFLPIFLYQIGLLFYPIKNWRVTRELSHHVIQAGGKVTAIIKIERKIPFPLYYCFCEEILPATLNKIDNRQEKYYSLDQPKQLFIYRKSKRIVFPWFRRVIELPYELTQIPRGEHQLRAIRIRTGDVFGFIKKEHIFDLPNELVAYPNERDIYLREQISSYEQGSVSSYTMHVNNTNVATGIREYMPGDRFSWIDWKQTARKNTVMTKEFEREKSTDTLIILDGCYHQQINVLAFEAAVEVSISLLNAIASQASQVGFLSIGTETIFFPVQHDPTKKDWIRKHLTRIQPTERRAFSLKLKEEMMKINSSFFVILIISHIDEQLKDTIRQLKLRKKRVHVIYIQAEKRITDQDYERIQQLQYEGVLASILTEKQLVKDPIGVNIL